MCGGAERNYGNNQYFQKIYRYVCGIQPDARYGSVIPYGFIRLVAEQPAHDVNNYGQVGLKAYAGQYYDKENGMYYDEQFRTLVEISCYQDIA